MSNLTNADHFPDEAQVPLLFNFDGFLRSGLGNACARPARRQGTVLTALDHPAGNPIRNGAAAVPSCRAPAAKRHAGKQPALPCRGSTLPAAGSETGSTR